MSTLRERIYRASGGRCHICGEALSFTDMDIDHLVPKAQGGTDSLSNLAAAHRRCNRVKQAIAQHVPDLQMHLSGAVHGAVVTSSVNPHGACEQWLRKKLHAGPCVLGPLPTEFWYRMRDIFAEMTANEAVSIFVATHKKIGALVSTEDNQT